MTTVLIVAFALLCGVSIGLVFGLMLGWAVFTGREPEEDLDYSGGL